MKLHINETASSPSPSTLAVTYLSHMTQSDIDWMSQLLEKLKQSDSDSLELWLGVSSKIDKSEGQNSTCFVTPANSRLRRIILNYENGKLDRIVLEGCTFSLPFSFLRSLTEEYKRTFNTYDAVDDEQFMFYPGKRDVPIVAIESWIPPDKQTENHASIQFSDIYIHLNKTKVPYHYRDGWHLIVPPR